MSWICCMKEWKEKMRNWRCQLGDVACLWTEHFVGFQTFTSLCKAPSFWSWDAAMELRVWLCFWQMLGESSELSPSTMLWVHDWASALWNKNRCRNNISARSSSGTEDWQACPSEGVYGVGAHIWKAIVSDEMERIGYEISEKIFYVNLLHCRTAFFFQIF